MPITYQIEFAPRTEKQLKIIPTHIRAKIFDRIEKLSRCLVLKNIEPLQGLDLGLFRIRQRRLSYSL